MRPDGNYDVASLAGIFKQAPFIAHLGIELFDLGPGWCKTKMVPKPEHTQQNGVLHAGVLTTIADHTAGAASSTLIEAGQFVLTLEFKINLLRASRASELLGCARVIKPGKSFIIVESEVYEEEENPEKMLCKGLFTIAVRDLPSPKQKTQSFE